MRYREKSCEAIDALYRGGSITVLSRDAVPYTTRSQPHAGSRRDLPHGAAQLNPVRIGRLVPRLFAWIS